MNIYAVNITNKLDADLYEEFLSLIDDSKRAKINKFKNSDDKIRTLIADILVRSIICNKLKIFNEEIEYEYNSYGKPKLKNSKEFHFNISHSGDWVIGVVDNQPVGIDIEKISPIEYIDIAKKFFKEDEYNWLLAQKDREKLEYFYKLWTLKESYIKMMGTGLSMPLDSFSILFDTEYNISIKSNIGSERERYFKTYAIDKNYMIAVCSEKDNFIP
ncbi:4'-phosphopantetheinyl transferase family protein [Clostridium algidicarnis]|uniref:4'-phosphopantetheinyl transferase family protein n=1 Tax=Clostridium algidicarnis TaxID=37659 RepID=UPI003FD78AF1